MKKNLSMYAVCAATLLLTSVAPAQVPKIPKDRTDTAENAEKASRRARLAEKAADASRQAEKASGAEKSASKAQSAQKAAEKATSAQKAAQQAESAQKAAAAAQKTQPAPPPEVRQPVKPREPSTPKVTVKPPPAAASASSKTTLAQPQKPPSANALKVKPTATPKLDPNRQAVTDAKSNNPVREPGGGPNPGLAGPNKGAAGEKASALVPETLRGQTDKNAALQDAANSLTGSPAASPVDSRLNDDKTKRPAFDQGFSDRPVVNQQEVENATDAVTNPTRGLTGGGVTGPLSDTAKKDGNVTGVPQQGSGAISDAPLPKGFKQVGPKVTSEFLNDIGLPSGDFGDQFKVIKNPKTGETAGVFIDSKTGVETTFTEEGFTVRAKDGKIITTGANSAEYKDYAAAVVKTAKELTGDGKNTTKPPTAGQPADETIPLKFDIVNTDSVAEQLRQSQLPKGGGTIDPTRTSEDPGQSGLGGVAGGPTAVKGALPQDTQLRNLVGSPTAPGVVNESGGNKGLDTFDQSRGVGGIRPTDDTTVSTSGIQDKPEDALGRNLGPDQGLEGRATSATVNAPSAALAQPLPEDKTAVRAAVTAPLAASGTAPQPITFGGKAAPGIFAPNLTLAQPPPEDKAAVARTIGPVSNVTSGSPPPGSLTTGGNSGNTSSSGSGIVGSSTGAPVDRGGPSAAPTPGSTDPAARAGELTGGQPTPPPPFQLVDRVTAPPTEPAGGVVTPRPNPSLNLNPGKPVLAQPTPVSKAPLSGAVGVKPAVSGSSKP